MPAEFVEDEATRPALKPFVLKWAEETSPEWLWGDRAVFSGPVNGLEVALLAEPDHVETSGAHEISDTSVT
jgi:hypothetical protein